MPQGNAPLTAPSANRFAGIWSNGKEPCPITLKDLVTIHNACVKMRSAVIEIPRSGALGSVDLSGYRNKLPQFLSHWQHRLSKVIRPATRIECLDEGADKIPPLFWKRWDKSKTANAQDDFIKEDLVKTFQLAHVSHNESFANFYEATYKKLPGKPKLTTAEELETLCMICILEYKVLGGCDLQWRDVSAETRAFLRPAGAGADDDAPAAATSSGSGGTGASPRRRGRGASDAPDQVADLDAPAAAAAAAAGGSPRRVRGGASSNDASPRSHSRGGASNNKRSAAATAQAQAAAAGEGAALTAADDAPAAAAADDACGGSQKEGQGDERDRQHDIDDIVNWGLEDDEFPLNKLEDMKFDAARPVAQQRTMHAAAILLFYRKRNAAQEKVFRDLCGLWGEVRGTHIQHALLCHPPSAGATMYTPNEAEWCRNAQKTLIARMDSELRNELEIPDPTDESSRARSRRGGRAAAGALDGQDNLRQPQATM